jgi:hypothetical protein
MKIPEATDDELAERLKMDPTTGIYWGCDDITGSVWFPLNKDYEKAMVELRRLDKLVHQP